MTKIAAGIESSIRDALIQTIANSPDARVADLLALASGEHAPMLQAITLGDLVKATAGKSRTRKGARTARASQSVGAAEGAPNTRTAEGRAAFDQAILTALKKAGGPTSASVLKNSVGGSSLQVRTSLNRLIEAGSVTFTGKARGTKYSLTD